MHFVGQTCSKMFLFEFKNTYRILCIYRPRRSQNKKMTLPFYSVISAPSCHSKEIFSIIFFSKLTKTFFFEAKFSNLREKLMTFSPIIQKSYPK